MGVTILNKFEANYVLGEPGTEEDQLYSDLVKHHFIGKTDAIEVGKKFINFPFLRFVAVDDEIIRRSRLSVKGII